jgi:hypothetical protein
MRQYCIDQLRPEDHAKIKIALEAAYGSPALEEVYRVPLARERLTPVQAAHGDCRPHYLALDLRPTSLACELLVRSASRLRCDCIAYATAAQREWAIALVDGICSQLRIIT